MIKLAILESDHNYVAKMKEAFAEKYADIIEVFTFFDAASAKESLADDEIDVFLSSAAFEIDAEALPAACGFAYFVDYPHIKTHNGQKAICRFQKPELIYNEILTLCQKAAEDPVVAEPQQEHVAVVVPKIIAFVSASGGVGSSVMSAACATAMAKVGKTVLYLNMERCGSANTFFVGSGQHGFGDIISAVKSRDPDLPAKMGSMVKRDNDSNVLFYDATHSPLDFMEWTDEDDDVLFEALKRERASHIIVDVDFSLDQRCLALLQKTGTIVFISDGSEVANLKFMRAFGVLAQLDQQNNTDLCQRSFLMYNRFSSKTSNMIAGANVSVLGGAPRYERATVKQIMKQLAGMPLFNGLM